MEQISAVYRHHRHQEFTDFTNGSHDASPTMPFARQQSQSHLVLRLVNCTHTVFQGAAQTLIQSNYLLLQP